MLDLGDRRQCRLAHFGITIMEQLEQRAIQPRQPAFAQHLRRKDAIRHHRRCNQVSQRLAHRQNPFQRAATQQTDDRGLSQVQGVGA